MRGAAQRSPRRTPEAEEEEEAEPEPEPEPQPPLNIIPPPNQLQDEDLADLYHHLGTSYEAEQSKSDVLR